MQIVKGDRNSQLRKDEETHLRKNKSARKYGTKAKNDPQSRAPLRWGGVVGNTMAGRHHGVPAGFHATSSQRKTLGKGIGQGPGAKDLLEGRTLMMMMMLYKLVYHLV